MAEEDLDPRPVGYYTLELRDTIGTEPEPTPLSYYALQIKELPYLTTEDGLPILTEASDYIYMEYYTP